MEVHVGGIAKKPAEKAGKVNELIQAGIDHLLGSIEDNRSTLSYITKAQRNTRTNEIRNMATLKAAEVKN